MLSLLAGMQSRDKTVILVRKTFGEFTCYAVEGKTFVSDNQPGRRDIGCKQVIRNFTKHVSRDLFLKSPFKLWGAKSNTQIKI